MAILFKENPNNKDAQQLSQQLANALYNVNVETTDDDTAYVRKDGTIPITGPEDFQAGLKVDTIVESTTGAGISLNNLANFLTGNAVTAAGNSQGTARLITKQFNTITGADGTKGIKLPLNYVGVPILIANDNSGILPVYPNTGGNIDGAGANTAITLAANETRFFFAISSTIWVSAQFLSKNWFVNTSGTFLPITDNTYDIGNGSVNPRDISASRNIVTNTIIEKTADAGVTIETVLVKDGNAVLPSGGQVQFDAIQQGQATLSSGVKNVTNASVTTGSVILITVTNTGTLTGTLTVKANAGSFDITSSVLTDTAVINWFIAKY